MFSLSTFSSSICRRKNSTTNSQTLLRRVYMALIFALDSCEVLSAEENLMKPLPDGRIFCTRPDKILFRSTLSPTCLPHVYAQRISNTKIGIGNILIGYNLEEPLKHIISEKEGNMQLQDARGNHIDAQCISKQIQEITQNLLENPEYLRFTYEPHTYII